MRSNRALSLLFVALLMLYTRFSNDLDLYIHPRYILFATLASIFASLAAVASLHSNHTTRINRGDLALLIVVCALAILPARALSVATINQRSTGSSNPVALTSGVSPNPFTSSSKNLSLSDWSRLLLNNPNPSYYANKPVDVSGFLVDDGRGSDRFLLARFVVTCCSVDAQPVGVTVSKTNWAQSYTEGRWLRIEGHFDNITDNAEDEIVLMPSSITTIDEPENPYAN